MSRRAGRAWPALGALAIAAAALSLALAARAEGFVYWANEGFFTTIGRGNLDGTGANQGFITAGNLPCGVAVNASHIFWTNKNTGTVGRANLDGTSPNPSFITGANAPCGVAVNGSHVFWTNTGSTTIGRANLDGTSPNPSFITTGSGGVCGVAVNASHVFWARFDVIGRANLNGTSPNQSFITGASFPCGVAVNASHVFWTNTGSTTIGRADLDGSPGSVNQSFITGANAPCGVAVNGTHLFWAHGAGDGRIGRANLNGTSPNQSFITGASFPCGVAVDALLPPAVSPSNAFTLGRLRRNRVRGTASLGATVPGIGRLILAGPQVRRVIRTPRAGSIRLPVRARRRALRRLNRTGGATVRFRVTYTPTGGVPRTKPRAVRLVKKR